MFWLNTLFGTGLEKLLQLFMPEALDHIEIVAWSAPRVNIDGGPVDTDGRDGLGYSPARRIRNAC